MPSSRADLLDANWLIEVSPQALDRSGDGGRVPPRIAR